MSKGPAAKRGSASWLGVLFGTVLLLQGATLSAEPGGVITSLLKVPLPPKLELCGEPVPLDREDVAERLEIELMVVLANPVSTALWFKRGGRYFPLIDEQSQRKGLPADLRYVPVVESNLRAEAVSSANAVGPWQFIGRTGSSYGLDCDSFKDDRKNWEEATEAGLSHLADLHRDLGSWPLALAAYNAGKGRVTRAMERQGEKDFYGLALPRETERYVFRIMAAKLVLERPEDYGIDLEGARIFQPGAAAMEVVVGRSQLPLTALAEAAGISFRRLKTLNAWMEADSLPKGSYTIKVPVSARETFQKALARWEEENPVPKIFYHRVRRGDTLSDIAQKYGVRLGDLMAWNSLKRRSVIHAGQRLTVRGAN